MTSGNKMQTIIEGGAAEWQSTIINSTAGDEPRPLAVTDFHRNMSLWAERLSHRKFVVDAEEKCLELQLQKYQVKVPRDAADYQLNV